MKDAATVPLEARLLRLFEELGIDRAHIAARDAADWRAFASVRPGRLASLSLLRWTRAGWRSLPRRC
jgi:hypothetical protein